MNVLATFGAVAFVDRLGRRKLLIIASIWMFVTQVIVAGTLGAEFQKYGADLPRSVSIGMLVVSTFPPTMPALQSFPEHQCRHSWRRPGALCLRRHAPRERGLVSHVHIDLPRADLGASCQVMCKIECPQVCSEGHLCWMCSPVNLVRGSMQYFGRCCISRIAVPPRYNRGCISGGRKG